MSQSLLLGPQRAAELAALERLVTGEIWTSGAAYEVLRTLCDECGEGHRFAGSSGEQQAAEVLRAKLEEYGLVNARLEPFPHVGWRRGPTVLEVVHPVSRRIPAFALPYCPATEVAGELVSVGEGEQEGYERAGAAEGRLRGAIAVSLAESAALPGRRSSHRREKYMRAVAAGAAAFLYVNQNTGDMVITGGLPGGGRGPAPIPGVGLSFEAGATLLRLAERGPVQVRLRTAAEFAQVETANVVADLPADPISPTAGELVLAGGHYDSHDVAHGALDNGAGTATVLEAARALAAVVRETGRGRLSRGLRFCFFGAEEIGLLGSWEYSQRHADELQHVRFMLNADTAGRGAPGTESLALTGCPELVPYFEEAGKQMQYGFEVRDRFAAASDHFPFVMAGLPAGTLSTTQTQGQTAGLIGRGWGHTAADTFDKVNPKSLQSAAMVAARLLLRIAETPAADWPGRCRTTAEVEAQLAAAGMLDDLRASGRWPPPRGNRGN